MYNDEVGHAASLTQQLQQANAATSAAQQETKRAWEDVQAAKAEAREANMANMRLNDSLQEVKIESKDLIVDNIRSGAWHMHCICGQGSCHIHQMEIKDLSVDKIRSGGDHAFTAVLANYTDHCHS